MHKGWCLHKHGDLPESSLRPSSGQRAAGVSSHQTQNKSGFGRSQHRQEELPDLLLSREGGAHPASLRCQPGRLCPWAAAPSLPFPCLHAVGLEVCTRLPRCFQNCP